MANLLRICPRHLGTGVLAAYRISGLLSLGLSASRSTLDTGVEWPNLDWQKSQRLWLGLCHSNCLGYISRKRMICETATVKFQSSTTIFTQSIERILNHMADSDPWGSTEQTFLLVGKGDPRDLELGLFASVYVFICILSYSLWPACAAWRTRRGLCHFLPSLLIRFPFWLCPLKLTSSIVLVILDEERDGVKHVLLSHIEPLRVVICFFDMIMFYTWVLT